MGKRGGLLLSALLLSAAMIGPALATEVKLTPERDFVEVLHQGKKVKVQRNQDQEAVVDPFWAKTSRKCPPFCIQPSVPVEGVQLATELDVLDFMENMVGTGEGVLIDARIASWHQKGTIPGSVNVPFTEFEGFPTDEKVVKVLAMLGGKRRQDVGGISRRIERTMGEWGIFDADKKTGYWDFTEAKEVMLWCNGPWCGQSPRAIRGLVKLGFPVGKIHYYRGGMQNWEMLGLTVVVPE